MPGRRQASRGVVAAVKHLLIQNPQIMKHEIANSSSLDTAVPVMYKQSVYEFRVYKIHKIVYIYVYIRLVSKNLKTKIYRIIILPVVLYGCETWSLKLREERRLRVLRRVFGSKRDEVTGAWRKLHNEELRDLYSLPNMARVVKSRIMRWAGHVARMGEGRGVHRVLVGKPEGKRPLGRPRRRWEYNIKMDLREVGIGGGDWMELAQDRDRWWALVNTVMNLRVP